MTQMGLDFTAGESLKESGISAVLASADAANFNWTDYALSLLEYFAKSVREFSSDEFRAHFVNQLPEPVHCNAYGALFSVAAKRGIIKHIGYVKSKRTSAHARIVSLWSLPSYAGGAL